MAAKHAAVRVQSVAEARFHRELGAVPEERVKLVVAGSVVVVVVVVIVGLWWGGGPQRRIVQFRVLTSTLLYCTVQYSHV